MDSRDNGNSRGRLADTSDYLYSDYVPPDAGMDATFGHGMGGRPTERTYSNGVTRAPMATDLASGLGEETNSASATEFYVAHDEREGLLEERAVNPLDSREGDRISVLDHRCHPKVAHPNESKTPRNQLLIVSACCTLFMAAEIAGMLLYIYYTV